MRLGSLLRTCPPDDRGMSPEVLKGVVTLHTIGGDPFYMHGPLGPVVKLYPNHNICQCFIVLSFIHWRKSLGSINSKHTPNRTNRRTKITKTSSSVQLAHS